jgi:hypothetical protein
VFCATRRERESLGYSARSGCGWQLYGRHPVSSPAPRNRTLRTRIRPVEDEKNVAATRCVCAMGKVEN